MPIHAISKYAAPIVPLEVPVGAIDALLPGGLERCEKPPGATNGTHPVLIPLAHNFDTRPSMFPLFAMNYLEFSVVIPGICRKGCSTPFTYIPILYLNRLLPILLGRIVYGFPKSAARISIDGARYRASTLFTGRELVTANLTPAGEPLPPAEFPHFAAIKPMLEYPIVTHLLGLFYVCSTMRWELDTEARIQPVNGDLRLSPSFFPGLPRSDFRISGIDTTPLGAFYLRTGWTMTLPHHCPS